MHRRYWYALYPYLNYSRHIFWGIISVVVVLLTVPDQQFKGFGEWAVSSHLWINSYSHWILLISIIAVTLTTLPIRHYGPPWIGDTIHQLLNDLQSYIFKDRKSDELHHHRLTIFRYNKRRGILYPVARSGHTTQKTKTIFRAPDDADKSEGVAGKTWASRKIVSVSNLPDVSGNCSESDIRKYSEKTNVSQEWLEENKPKCRSLCGVPIENNGIIWGVIVLDSRDTEEIGTDDLYEVYRIIGKHLGKLLERAKL